MRVHKIMIGLVLVLCLCLTACTPTQFHPMSGTWYCEELQAQVLFDYPENWDGINNDESGIYAIVDGEKIACICVYDEGSKVFAIECYERNNDKYNLSETIYCLEHVSLSDTEYVVKDEAGNQYTFIRQD